MDAIRNEINFISIMDFEKVIMNIVESAKFDKIIIDSGNNVTEITKYIMNIADNIVFIKSKIDTLYEKLFLKEVVTVDNFDKLITVSNFNYNVNVKFNDFFEDEDEKEIIKVYEEKEAFLYQGGIVDIEIDGLFGKGIREIVSKINNGKY